jgi:hypothetical protein
VVWNTEWVPDQSEPMKIMARIEGTNGMVHMTDAASDLSFDRPGYSVELCTPYDVPKGWLLNTNKGTKSEHFDVGGNLSEATGARLDFSVLAPHSLPGLYVNGTFVSDGGERPTEMTYYPFEVVLDQSALRAFQAGRNTLSTGTPVVDNHGTQVHWPGIMVTIKYGDVPDVPVKSVASAAAPAGPLGVYTNVSAGTVLQVSLRDAEKGLLEISAMNGRTCARQAVSGSARYDFKHGGYAPGVYVIRLISSQGAWSRKVYVGR